MELWTPYANNPSNRNNRPNQHFTNILPNVMCPPPVYREVPVPPFFVMPRAVQLPICYDIPRRVEPSSSSDEFYKIRRITRNMVEEDCLSDDPEFQEFERKSLENMSKRNGGSILANNPRMRRTVQSKNETGDEAYRRQRERNNLAAKQSRDRRKLREIHQSHKVTFLKKKLAEMKSVLATKRCRGCQKSCSD